MHKVNNQGILAIDAGTTGVTALVVSTAGQIVAQGYSEFPQYFPAKLSMTSVKSGRPP